MVKTEKILVTVEHFLGSATADFPFEFKILFKKIYGQHETFLNCRCLSFQDTFQDWGPLLLLLQPAWIAGRLLTIYCLPHICFFYNIRPDILEYIYSTCLFKLQISEKTGSQQHRAKLKNSRKKIGRFTTVFGVCVIIRCLRVNVIAGNTLLVEWCFCLSDYNFNLS